MSERLRPWAPEAALALLVLAVGVAEALNTGYDAGHDGRGILLLVALATAVLVLLCRRHPGPAVAGVWALGVLQVVENVQAMLIELAIVAVAFGAARWGRPLTVFVSGLSIPAAVGLGVLVVGREDYFPLLSLTDNRTLVDALYRLGDTYVVGTAVVGVALLGVPWLAGLALRFSDHAKTSLASQAVAEDDAARAQRETEQAREIARLRDGQARLARDVHDVVGHSLAVILAQAESAQYLADDPDRLRATMATIATSARSSLQDVRTVLTPDDGHAATAAPRALDTLVEGVRASGHEVVSREIGTPQPLPPELEVVAYRVLQEMLTNALRHGRRDEPVFVERHWPDGAWAGELRIEVRNTAEPRTGTGPGTGPDTVPVGQGLPGMRRRLDSVGGRLDVRPREEDAGTTFTTTAWVPVRSVTP